MLPHTEMLAIKKQSSPTLIRSLGLALGLFLAGCTPPGPRSLLDADQLIREGKYQQAVRKLETARKYMERDPRVYNWLGMAYQGAGDAPQAIEAYRRALALDRSNLVFVAHYNLGSLYLDCGNAVAAANELRSYLVLSNSPAVRLKLGQAELRARQFDAAERTFGDVLRSQPRDPAAWNGLGLVKSQRNRAQEAANCFQSALRNDPKYGPALLNLAVLYHQQPSQRAYAAQKYAEYLALEPRPANYDAVKTVLQGIEAELAALRIPTNVPAPTIGKTNLPASLPNTALLASTQRTVLPLPTNLARLTNLPVRAVPQTTSATQVAATTLPTAVRTNVTPGGRVAPIVVAPRPVAVTSAPPPVLIVPTSSVTVVTLTETKPASVARDVGTTVTPAPVTSATPPAVVASSPTAAVDTGNTAVITAPAPKPSKKSFLQKLNPFGGKSKKDSKGKTATTTVAARQSAEKPVPPSTSTTLPPSNPPKPVLAPAVDYLRYTYLSPAKPLPGDRKAAEPLFAQGLKAHHENKIEDALKAYRAAVEKDPAYYEAYYNMGLLAEQIGDLNAASHAYEGALAVNPQGANARVELAQVLDKANHPIDAANELEKVIQVKPDDVRAQLRLAILCANKLGQPARARVHYLKVIELDPRHPKADEIRYWLAANP